jgi:hypothetical protein
MVLLAKVICKALGDKWKAFWRQFWLVYRVIQEVRVLMDASNEMETRLKINRSRMVFYGP